MNIKDIKAHAAKEATGLLEEYGITAIPIDVHAIADKLGVQIVSQDLDVNTSGVIVIKRGQAVIGVNKDHHRRRQRFTIAHELGHFIIHSHNTKVFVDTTYTFYRDGNSTEGTYIPEIQANAFAAELLMPEHIFKRYSDHQQIDLFDEIAIKHLARIFDVSEQAVTIRLINLGLITDKLLF